jgi:hypothetical protein
VLLVENMPNSDSILNTEGWGEIDWRKVERYVFKLQTRIYAASRRGEVKEVRKLQRTLMRSWSNRVLAVRRVTQDNTGKNTAGVDRVGESSRQDNLTYLKLRRWAKRRCLTSSAGHYKYWHSEGSRNWVFSTGTDANSLRLNLHRDVSCSSTDYVKVKGDKSPYDGDLVYWSSRMGQHPEMSNREAKLLRQQKGKCTHCGLTFREGDVMEVDHIIPKSSGGKDEKNTFTP